jgi:hypothetical protein
MCKATPIISKHKRRKLEKICNELVRQGPLHKSRIIEYYRIMYLAARQEFTEDNKATLDGFLEECHKISSNMTLPGE